MPARGGQDRQTALAPVATGKVPLLLRRRSRSFVAHVPLHALLHACFPASLKFLHPGLLVGREQLEQFVVNSGVLHGQFDHGLRLLRGERTNLGLVEGSFLILTELLARLVHLLHQGFERAMLFLQDGLHLCLLGIGQIEGTLRAQP